MARGYFTNVAKRTFYNGISRNIMSRSRKKSPKIFPVCWGKQNDDDDDRNPLTKDKRRLTTDRKPRIKSKSESESQIGRRKTCPSKPEQIVPIWQRSFSLCDIQSRPLPPVPTKDALLMNQHYYEVNRDRGAESLRGKLPGSFLLRRSECYYCILMVKMPSTIANVPVLHEDGKFQLLKAEKKFDTLEELIEFYRRNYVSTEMGDVKLCSASDL